MAKYATTQLDSVNEILSVLGQAPVNSLELKTPDVAMILNILGRTDRVVQGRGWYFNHLPKVEVTADANSKYAAPENWIRADVLEGYEGDKEIVIRNGFFYDLKAQTYELGVNKLTVEAVEYLDWEDLPEEARHLITMVTARQAAERLLNAADKSGWTQQDVYRAEVNLRNMDRSQADARFSDSQDYMVMIRGRGQSGAGVGPIGSFETLTP